MQPSNAQKPLEVARSDDAFSRALYARLAAGEGNLVLSPTSVESCVLLALAGARGQTAAQIAGMLHLSGENRAEVGQLLDRYRQQSAPGKPGEAGLVIANSAWVQNGVPLEAAYKTLLQTGGRATLEVVDFMRQTEAARRAINAWVDEATAHKIEELISPGLLDVTSRLVLANAIYFKGSWLAPFDKRATQDQPFHLPGAADTSVPLMHLDSRVRYLETDTYQAIELPYANSDMAMVVWLPRAVDGLSKMERQLAATSITESLEKLGTTGVEVFLPRFKIDSSTSLAETLTALGMQDAFGPHADFSGISSEPLQLSAVVHQALIEVDEVGTEGAAATAIVARTAAALPGRVEKKIFRADHPFLFAIRNRSTADVLFIGRLAAPAR